MRTVSPDSAEAATTSRMKSSLASGSRLATGSSRSSSGARLASAMVSATWACWPPDSDLTFRPSGMSSAATRARASPASQLGLSDRPKRNMSATVNPRYSGWSCAR